MAEYRAVQCAFWQDPFILDLTPEEKYFYLYLMTNPKTTQCGVYELPMRVMEMETGYNRETVSKLVDRFTEYGKIRYDKTTCEVILLNWLRHNWIGSEKVIKRIQKDTVSIKNQEFRDHINTILIGYGYGIDTVPEKEKEKEKEKKIKTSTSENAPRPSDGEYPALPANPEAAIQSPKGGKWGTAEDLATAQAMFELVRVVSPTAKTPNWADWANDVRLMRVRDGKPHHKILGLFRWANKDPFWSTNVLSPGKLRDKWGTLAAQANKARVKQSPARPQGVVL